MKKQIILIGFMGSGKSTIGKKLARSLEIPLLDTDGWIEEKQRKTISELFVKKGESFFRTLETDCLNTLLTCPVPQVIATGGGLPQRPENRELLKRLGTVIYLKVSAEEVMKRLAGDRTRPLLASSDPYEKTVRLLAEREEAYRQTADIVIDTTGKTPEAILCEILASLTRY